MEVQRSGADPIEVLPAEMFMQVLSFLGGRGLSKASLVCSSWYSFIMSEECELSCWRRLAYFYYPSEARNQERLSPMTRIWRDHLHRFIRLGKHLSFTCFPSPNLCREDPARISPYEVLQVPKDADMMTIKKAYRKLAMRWHPERCVQPDLEDNFKAIAEAYEILSDPEKRAFYDIHGVRPDKAQLTWNEDALSPFFGGMQMIQQSPTNVPTPSLNN